MEVHEKLDKAEGFLTLRELRERLKTSASTAHRLKAKGVAPFSRLIKLGRRYFIPISVFNEWATTASTASFCKEE